jgi:hypothetical protein
LLLVGRQRVLDGWRARAGRHKDSANRRRHDSTDALAHEPGALDDDLLELLDAPGTEATETFKALDDHTRRILTLHLAGLSAREIATAIGAPSETAARRRLARAWEALRRLFIATEREADCGAVRTSLAALDARRAGAPEAALAEAIDYQRVTAHLEACPHCRAFEKRAKGLLITHPAPTVPLWQQVAQRAGELLPGSTPGRGAEAAAGTLLGGGGAKLAAALCTGALATGGVCATLIAERHDSKPRRAAPATAPTPTRASLRAEPTRGPARTATSPTRATTTTQAKPRTHAARASSPAAKARRDTRQAEQAQPAAAPAGSDHTSELLPTGSAGSDPQTPPTPAPSTGGGEFLP